MIIAIFSSCTLVIRYLLHYLYKQVHYRPFYLLIHACMSSRLQYTPTLRRGRRCPRLLQLGDSPH